MDEIKDIEILYCTRNIKGKTNYFRAQPFRGTCVKQTVLTEFSSFGKKEDYWVGMITRPKPVPEGQIPKVLMEQIKYVKESVMPCGSNKPKKPKPKPKGK